MKRKLDVPEDPAEHAARFSIDWRDRMEAHARRRLRELGIPEDQIGALDESFGHREAAFHPREETGGGISPGRRINLNSGVFNPDLLRPMLGEEAASMWERLPLRHRMDAVIAHEYEEGKSGDHERAVIDAASTELPISERAREMLQAIAGDVKERSR